MKPIRLLLQTVVAAVVLCASAAALGAQGSAGTAKSLQADYAVPDAPALKMLVIDGSKLLRPATAQAFTAALATASGGLSYLPRAFAVEFSPGLLNGGENLTLYQYQQQPWRYRTRVSLAAKRDSGAGARSEIAAALRIGLDDQSDLRTNGKVLASIDNLTKIRLRVLDSREAILLANKIPADTASWTPEQTLRANVILTRFEIESASLRADETKLLVAAKKAIEESQWNASVFDLAVGVRGSAVDSTGAGMQFDGVAGWATKGWALGSGRQLLLGARGAYERDFQDTTTTDLKPVGDAALRFYTGSNRYKALTELQATARRSDPPKWLARLGGEAQLAASMWIDASIGYQAEGKLSTGKVITSLKFKFQPGS